MNKLFDINELTDIKHVAEDFERSKAACIKFIDIHTSKINSLKQMVGNPPSENEIIFLWTINSFNSFTFIPYMLWEYGKIDELIITTYSINRRIIDSLMRYVDKGNIYKILLLCSDSIKFRIPRIYEHLESLAQARKDIISIKYSWNHSKVALARSGDVFMVMEGSGNFSENAQYEQYILTNSKQLYEFRKQCIDEIE